MRDCTHIVTIQGQQLPNGAWTANSYECDLKTTPPVRLQMAMDAQAILGVPCPANDDCHYHPHDRCEDCPAYSPLLAAIKGHAATAIRGFRREAVIRCSDV